MSLRRIFCEGPDDLPPLRALIIRDFGYARSPGVRSGVERQVSLNHAVNGHDLQITVADDRNKALTRAVEAVLEYGSPSVPLDIVGLSFDPNGDDEAGWRRWLESGLARHKPTRIGDDYEVTKTTGNMARFVPLPWHAEVPSQYGLAERSSLERLAVNACVRVHPDQHAAIERWMNELRGLGTAPNWKTAARLWNAAILPEVAGPSFFERVFSQEARLAAEMRAILVETPLWSALTRVCK